MNYTHLTQDERYQIYILLKAGKAERFIQAALREWAYAYA
jgi:IS30 family transposase